MYSSAKMSLVYLVVSLILTFAMGGVFGFSYDGKLSPFGSALAFFFFSMLLFLGLFGLIHFIDSWRFESNPWIVDVKEMGFWNNPIYTAWLFYHDHKKWAKWNTVIFSVFAVFVVSLFGAILTLVPASPPIAPENFWKGWAIATTLKFLFAFTWYQNYASVDRTPSPFPKGRLSDIPRRL